jgi:hypothetical protein
MLGAKLTNVRLQNQSTFDHGRMVVGTYGASFQLMLSCQPTSGTDIKTFPDSVRESVKYLVLSYVPLNTYDKTQPHQIQVDGEWFDLTGCESFSSIIPHYEYYACKVKEGD